MTVRRFRTLARGMPFHDSALGGALGARQPGEWGNVEELLALNAHIADATLRSFIKVHTKRHASTPALKIDRPPPRTPKIEPPKKARRQATSEELVAFFGGAARYTGRRSTGEDPVPTAGDENPVLSPAEDPESPTLEE
jgi:hypothetical protein